MIDSTKKVELEKRIVMGLTAVFAVVLLFGPLAHLGLLGTRRTPSASAVVAAPPAVQPTPQGPPSVSSSRTEISFEPAYTAQKLRDPLISLLQAPEQSPVPRAMEQRPTPPREVALPPLKLQGIMWGGRQPSAIINGTVYTVGDTVQGATIRAIEAGRVWMEFQGTKLPLTMRAGTGGSP